MSVVDEVRDRLDIVEVVSDYVPLKKAGRTYKALCPFHSEKTPSFVVFPETGTWRCFGACASGGDVFEFVMRMEKMDFRAALEALARRTGVELAPPTPAAQEQKAQRERLREAMTAAAVFFHQQLMRSPSAEPARAYLKGRGFTGDVAREFELGFAPDSWSALGKVLRDGGFSEDEMLAAGLVRQRDTGGVYDAFRGRLTFPIRDARGRTVGFGARTLDPEGVPKYVNSSQTALFDKSRVLYGLERAARAIRDAGEAVVVEGYTDVIRAHAAGFRNVVASLGTALTNHQIAMLKRHAPTVILALDADAAGQAATVRGLEVASEAAEGGVMPVPTARGWVRYEHRLEMTLAVARLPVGQDPDDVIREDPDRWRALIEGAQPVMEYLFEVLTADLDLEDPRHKMAAADRLMPLIAGVPDPVGQAAWVARLAELIRIDERTLSGRLMRPARRSEATRSEPAGRPERAPVPRDRATWLLGHLLVEPRRLRDLNERLATDGQPPLGHQDLERTTDRDLFDAVRYATHGVPPPDAPPEHRLDALPDPLADYAAVLRERAAGEPPAGEGTVVASLREAVLRLRRWQRLETLEGLKFLQAEAAAEERSEYNVRVEDVRAVLRELDQLLAPSLGPEAGKIDVRLERS